MKLKFHNFFFIIPYKKVNELTLYSKLQYIFQPLIPWRPIKFISGTITWWVTQICNKPYDYLFRYDEYKHLGYDWDGKQIIKPETGDHLDEFLKRMEDPDFWRTVKDPQTGQNVILSEEDINLIKRIKAQKIPDVNFDEYAPWIEW